MNPHLCRIPRTAIVAHCCFAGIVLPATTGGAQARVWRYRTVQVTDNDVQDSNPTDINADGDVVWLRQQAVGSDFYDVCLYAQSTAIRITNTHAFAEWGPRINDAGWICFGRTENPVGPQYMSQVWLYPPGGPELSVSPQPQFPTDSHWAPEINNSGDVTWHFSDTFSAPTRVYLYSGGVAEDISDTGLAQSQCCPRVPCRPDAWPSTSRPTRT